MSINKFYDIPPETRQRNFPASFKTLKVSGKPVAPNNYIVGDFDIDYSDDKDGQTYINTIENGNTTLYGYVKLPYYERTNHNPIFGGVNRQVTTAAELDSAILASNDGDAIELMNSITYSMGESLTITASIKIYTNENNVSLISTLGAGSATYFIDVYSEDFQFHNIGLYSNSTTTGAMIRFNTNCINATVSECFCSSNQPTIASFSQSLFLYNSTFTPLGLQPITLIVLQNFSDQVQIKGNVFAGSQPIGFKSNTTAIYITNVALPCEGEIFFDNNDFGVNVAGQEMNTVLLCDGSPNGLDFYFSNNVIFTNSAVCSFDNHNFLSGLKNLQAVNNGVSITEGYENDFTGFFYLKSSTPGAGSYPPTLAKVRSYENILPTLGVMFPATLPVQTSTTENPVLTYSTETFINPPTLFINPPLISYISIDSSPGGASGVFTPMIENLNANNYNVYGVNIVGTSTIQAYSTPEINVINDIKMSGNDITNVRIMSVGDIEPLTTGGHISINGDLEMNLNKIESVDTLTAHTVRLQFLENSSATASHINLSTNMFPSTALIDLGSSTASEKFNNIYASNTRSDNVFTNELNSLSGNITLNNTIHPDTPNLRNIGDVVNYFASYFGNTINIRKIQPFLGTEIQISNELVPTSSNAVDLGSSSNYFKDIYSERLVINAIDGLTTTNVTMQCNTLPDLTNVRTIGNSTLIYKELHSRLLSSDVTLMLRATNDQNDRFQFGNSYFRPLVDNTKSLGLAGQRWTTVYAVNGTINTSSRTKKRNIMDCKMGLDFIDKLQPKMYIYNDDSDDQPNRCGLIYEDVEDVINAMPSMTFAGLHKSEYDVEDPDTGDKTHETHYGIDYTSFIAPLIGAVKELKTEVESLKAEIAILKGN